jgi:hypothetical protein
MSFAELQVLENINEVRRAKHGPKTWKSLQRATTDKSYGAVLDHSFHED